MAKSRIVISPTSARQGDGRRMTLRVLALSIFMAVVAGGLALAVFYSLPSPQERAGEPQALPTGTLRPVP